jgi:predicted SPOUT superfamily RNA methylase MTH1
MKRTYDGKIIYTGDDCTLHFVREGYVYADLKAAFEDGAKVTVDIKSRRKPRSLPQNNFYWGYFLQFEIDCFLEFWGELYDKKQIHEWNKQNFLGDVRAIENTGEVVRMPGSSKELSTVEFEAKLDDIRQWFLLNFDFIIPYPNEQGEIDLT